MRPPCRLIQLWLPDRFVWAFDDVPDAEKVNHVRPTLTVVRFHLPISCKWCEDWRVPSQAFVSENAKEIISYMKLSTVLKTGGRWHMFGEE